jgi:hypothetical protein
MLIGHWPLNGNTNDISTYGNNGVPTNVTYTTGKIGQAASFNGSSSFIDYGDRYDMGAESFSISAWIKTSLVSATSTTIVSKAYLGAGNFRYAIFLTNGKITAFMQGNGGADVSHEFNTVVANNNWRHITVIFKRNSVIEAYIDGVKESTTSVAISQWNGLNFDNIWTFKIGAYTASNQTSPALFFNGQINDVRVFNHALTDFEVQEIARGKILHYSFDDFQEPTTNLVVNPLNPTISPWSNINMISTQDSNGFYKGSETTTSGSHIVGQPFTTQANTIYTQSVVVKSHNRRYVGLSFTNYGNWTGGNGGHTYFDLEAGIVFSTIGSGPIDKGIKNLGDGSFRLYITALSTNAVSSRINLFTYESSALTDAFVGDVTKGIFFKEYQLEKKSHPTEFTVGTRSSTVRDNSGFFNDSNIVTLNGYGYEVNHIDQYGTWVKIFRHNVNNGTVIFSNITEAQYTNPDNPMANKFSLLNQINNFIRTDGKYKFKLSYPLQEGIQNSGYTNIWFQTSDPTTSAAEFISGYQPISVEATSQNFTGLVRSSATTNTYLDGGNGGNWFYAVGALSYWNGGIPGPYQVAVSQGIQLVEVYICIEDTKFINRYPKWTHESKLGVGTYDFNGTTNKIEPAFIPFTDSKDDFTISLWVNPDTVATGSGLGNRFVSWGDATGRFFFGNFQGSITLGTGNTTLSPSGYVMTAGSWQHFAVSNTGSTTKFYKNGQLTHTLTNTSTANISSALPFRIGAQYANGEGIEFFDGKMDDVRIYKTALSDKDILDLYNTKAEIEQSGVLYARDFLSNAEPVLNILSTVGNTRGEFTANHGTSTTFRWDIEQKVRVGEEYVFSGEFFRNILHSGRIYAMFRLEDSSGVLIPGDSGLIPGWAATVAEPLYKYFHNDIRVQADGKWYQYSLPKITIPAGYENGTIRWIQFVITTSPTDASFITTIRKPQFERGAVATNYAETFRPAIELPSTLDFAGNEVHETGTANFEDFSTVGITDGLIGYWPLNGSAIDYSGNNYNGTVSGALTVSGLNDRAYSFDGVDDYISTDLSIKNVDKTISFFIKKNGASTAGAVINQWYAPASWLVYTVQTSGFIRYYSHNGSATDTITSTISVCDNAWHHVAMTYTSSNNLLSIYIDGTFNISKNLTVEEATTSSNGLWIGRENGPIVYNPLQGILDEIKVFNRALTAEEVAIEYNTMFNNEVQIHEDGVVYAKDIVQY